MEAFMYNVFLAKVFGVSCSRNSDGYQKISKKFECMKKFKTMKHFVTNDFNLFVLFSFEKFAHFVHS